MRTPIEVTVGMPSEIVDVFRSLTTVELEPTLQDVSVAITEVQRWLTALFGYRDELYCGAKGEGWSMQRIADTAGVSKSAVAHKFNAMA